MTTIADYEAWKARQNETNVGAAQVVLGATTEQPDALANDLNLANEYGKATGSPVPPAPMVKEFRPVFQQAVEREKNKTILSNAPRLTEWLRNPDNATLGRDDLQNLSWFDGFGRGLSNSMRRAGERLTQMGNQYMLEQTAGRAADRESTFGQLVDQGRFRGRDSQGNEVVGLAGPSAYLGAFARWVDARYADLIGTDDTAAAQQYAAGVKAAQDRMAAIPKSEIATGFEKSAMVEGSTLGQTLANFGAAFMSNPLGGLSWALETAGESAPQLGAAVGVTAVTRNPSLGAATMFGGSYTTERYTSPADFLKDKGIDLGKPEDVQRVITDPALLRDAAEKGAIRGLVIGAFDAASLGVAGRSLAGNPLVEAVAQGATQMLLGSSGEYFARLASGQSIDWNEVVAEGLAELATTPVDLAIAGRRLARDRSKAAEAENTKAKAEEVSTMSQASALRNRMPDKFREFVEGATANGPVENVFIPANDFVQYFQSAGIDPYALIDGLEGVTRDDLDVALAGGGDLQIPTATYAAKIAGTEHDAFLIDNMRFDPNEFTPREAAEFNARSEEIMQEAFEEAERLRMQDESLRSFEQEIYDTMVSRLRTAGRSTDVATTEAMLYPAFYRVMAERSGMTTEDFMQRYPLPRVEGDLPQGMQFRDVDALNRTLAEARNRRAIGADKRRSLLEFISDYGGINDPGGELRSRNAETIKRGKGKKTLKLARKGIVNGMRDMLGSADGKKFGVDDVALAAIEAGYMADDPTVHAYQEALRNGTQAPDITASLWNAIDNELSGEREFSAQDAASPDLEHEQELDQVEEYLKRLGVSLNDDDATIREAIRADQEAEGRKYGQAGGLGAIEKLASDAGVSMSVSENNGIITLSKIVAGERNGGAGTRVMRALTNYADATGQMIALTPSKDFGGTVSRLKDFYSRFGFVENKGKNKVFETRETMIREPQGRAYSQRNEMGERGSIRFPAAGVGNGETIISLFENANLSTMLHESGHYFLTVMQDLSARGEAQAVADVAALNKWWGDNAADVARDANRSMPDAKVTADDVTAFIENGSTGDVMKDGAIDVGMQEQFARGFEAYLMEGKAPSADLRGAFEKFRAWLISIYQRLAGLNVNVSPDIKAVFDRMLASDAEIAEAQAQSGEGSPVFATAEAMGLTQEEYDAFMKLRSQAEDEAKARMLRETMEPIKREREKWFKDEKAKVREEVTREVNSHRYYRAIEWMGNRRWLGEGQPDNMPDIRLSKDILVERYGEGVLKTLPRGKQTVYAVEGGLDPEDAAGWFGFDSGDEMVRAMETAPPRKEAIEAETDKLMRERHGDVLTDGSAEAVALEAVHNDKRGQWLAAELKAVAEVAGVDVAMTAKEARASARSAIAQMRVRDAMNANRFLAAERKAGEEAARLGAMLARDSIWMRNAQRRIASKAKAALKGNASPDAAAAAIDDFNRRFETTSSTYSVPEQKRVSSKGNEFTIPAGERTSTKLGYNDLVAKYVEAKRRQLLNHAFYSEARKVGDEVEKTERYVAKLNKATMRERIAGAGRREGAHVDYLSAIDEILDRYDFRRMSGPAEERRGSLNAFIDAMKAAGRENELAIPESVLADAARKPYKTIPVEEMRGVVDSLKNLEHIALRWNDLIDAINKKKLDEAVDEITLAFDENVKKRPPGRVNTTGEALRNATRQFIDLVLNATTILREIDGFKDAGAAYRNIKAPIDEAMNRLIGRKEKAAADLEKLYDVYSKDERRRMSVREHIPALGYALSKWERIAVALNTGNEGNFTRLTDPTVRGSLTPEQVNAVMATLDERDADFIQSVWDYVGSFRSDIAARERRTTGVEPAWVEAQPVEIAGKTLRGGYYPLKYDPRLSSLARDDDAILSSQSLQAGRFGKAQTRNGHLQARAQSSGRDIELDMSVLHRHVNQVIYDLELSEPVTNAWRILQDGRVRNSFIQSGKQADFDALEIWLQDVGNGELKSADFLGRSARMLKSNFTAAKLAFNISTVAMQITGLSQTMVIVGKRDFAKGITASFQPGAVDAIAQKSSFMRTRQTTFNKDIFDFYNDPKLNAVASRWGDIKKEVIGPAAFWLMTKVQWYLVDVPTWLAGYNQGLRRFGNDEAKAIAHADDIVKRAQASGLFSDRSAIERGSVSRTARQNDVVRLFTALGSYMFAKFNVAYERSSVAARIIGEEGISARSAREALSWTIDMGFLFTFEAVITAAIKGKLPGGDDDDEDESWLKFLAKETGLSVMSTVPFIRDGASAMQGYSGGGAYGGAIEDAFKGIFSLAKVASSPVTGAEVKKSDIKAVINGTGLVTGLPSTQVNRAVDAAIRQSQGDDVSPLEYLLGKMGK